MIVSLTQQKDDPYSKFIREQNGTAGSAEKEGGVSPTKGGGDGGGGDGGGESGGGSGANSSEAVVVAKAAELAEKKEEEVRGRKEG